MKILITGSQGQLGQCLIKAFSIHKNVTLITCNKQQLDITNEEAVFTKLLSCRPDIVINTAAYTGVDKAEEERELAFSINALAPKYLAKASEQINAALIHISTDYVFDGEKLSAYNEFDTTNPQSVYGASKLAGEVEVVQYSTKYIILRTAWVFSEFGNNFAKTMIKLSHLEKLSIVDDQIGAPTNANDIAQALATICEKIISNENVNWGIYHYSGEPYCSWFDFAQQIFFKAMEEGAINQSPILNSIPTTQYPTPAKRPKNSRLDNTKIKCFFAVQSSDWQASLINMAKFVAKP
ncbi:MAG: dTDP-4-dehydrorhamnose reductase [Colwellia sp.]